MKAYFALLLIAATKVSVSALHYEQPPCASDEKAIQVMGIDGDFCSPQCSPDCPTDVPPGVTASPMCALQSPTGEQYCAIICTPSLVEGGPCGSEMSCAPIPGSGGYGLCVYPSAESMLRVPKGISATFFRSPESINAEFVDRTSSEAASTVA
mmetsp:Transcript_627/g.1486  ORF Transcript_627/g.1486 Transcript_627/m.1486 type:complete len:153 (-) Transcript_627:230-688(-)|eukprot:CAMPEP_0172370862 /NCGR_PEP_ID=MMETSP1060-20121228/40091_1 /TAXON_ID=37318 /ORGANISM="Pseudo-nitzschia pungens, Strain cf. cingulata" /LENGTH=152 /DNA_ID=CAMNT_0013096305 /DNA_START=58 /DNA_END=516 /DNA_ORIENTATION=+